MKNRICALFVSGCLVASLCVPLAYADDASVNYSGTATLYTGYQRLTATTVTSHAETLNYPATNLSYIAGFDSSIRDYYYGIRALQDTSQQQYTGAFGVYISYFAESFEFTEDSGITPHVEVTYINHMGQEGTSSADISTFDPTSSDTYSTGYSIKAQFVGGADAPITDWKLDWGTTGMCGMLLQNDGAEDGYLVIPSCTVVGTDSDASLDALEGLADQIAAQNKILSAMYGDIMAVCNSIYSRLGDIQATEELATTYLGQIASYLNHMDTTTSAIYSLLGTQFAALISAVNSASVDIQAAIAKQTEDILEYLDDAFSASVGELPGKTDNLQGQISNNQNAENNYKSSAAARFDELSATFTGFTGGTLSGVSLASTLFSRVWVALGEYQVVYTFPLLLGLCLLVVGRLGRLAGRSHSNSKEGSDDA